MTPTSAKELAVIVGGLVQNLDGQRPLTGFAWDSRLVQPGDLFLCIQGERVDGHDFAGEAIKSGATAALSERELDVPHILVPNVLGAIARIGIAFRERFEGTVFGITGSNGKTTTKEFLSAALGVLGPVVRTKGNQNTEITSPLVWTDAPEGAKHAVVEMAMRGFGQIRHLALVARPNVGIVTNIGWSHLEMVGSRDGIARAKAELLEVLPPDGVAILWKDDDFYNDLAGRFSGQKLFFGFGGGTDCTLTHYKSIGLERCHISGECLGKRFDGELPVVGRHVALDAAAAILGAVQAGMAPQDALEAMSGVALPPMRMQVVEYRGAKILMDAYNASPTSLKAAADTLSDFETVGRKYAVVGEMLELGDFSAAAHRGAARDLAARRFDGVCFFGDAAGQSYDEVRGDPRFVYAHSKTEVREFLERLLPNDVCLIKGSRALELEKVLESEGS